MVFEGLPLGRVELAYSTSATDTLRMWIRVVSIVAILFVIASFIASIKFSAAIVQPLDAMVQFTKEVKKGNLSGRVPQHVGAWEMRLLAHHLNVMTRAIHQRDIALAKQQAKLEANLQTIHETREQLLSSTRLAAESLDGRALLYVEDDGPGIAEEHKAFLFESNFTTRGSSDGTGLGLAIARRLVRAVEGDLMLHSSELGNGATFQISLPRPGCLLPEHGTAGADHVAA